MEKGRNKKSLVFINAAELSQRMVSGNLIRIHVMKSFKRASGSRVKVLITEAVLW
jgi:hypothetical protein